MAHQRRKAVQRVKLEDGTEVKLMDDGSIYIVSCEEIGLSVGALFSGGPTGSILRVDKFAV